MQGGLIPGLQLLAPIAVTLMVLIALALLWRMSRSVWLIVAIAGEIAAFAFNIVIVIAPGVARSMSPLFPLWTIAALVFAGGLLGYAIETSRKAVIQ
jgi:hypothetical protein